MEDGSGREWEALDRLVVVRRMIILTWALERREGEEEEERAAFCNSKSRSPEFLSRSLRLATAKRDV